MFPHPCGTALAQAVSNGADPQTVVPDEFLVVRGGLKPCPLLGTQFSATAGPTLEAAGCAIPHGNLRYTTARQIRQQGGVVEWVWEFSPHGTLNEQHVHVTEQGATCFSEPVPNPVAKKDRIDRGI
jgi:hypothetical protein